MQKWTFNNAELVDEDDVCSVAFSPELEPQMNALMIEAFGMKYLQGERTTTDEGLVQIRFEADKDDAQVFVEALKQFYWSQNRITTDQ